MDKTDSGPTRPDLAFIKFCPEIRIACTLVLEVIMCVHAQRESKTQSTLLFKILILSRSRNTWGLAIMLSIQHLLLEVKT